MVVKGRVQALRVSQIVLVFPAPLWARIFRRPEPEGNQPRRPGGVKVKEQVAKDANKLYAEDVITQDACDYLVEWAEGRRAQLPPPKEYPFLRYRWGLEDRSLGEPLRISPPAVGRPVRVSILGLSRQALPDQQEQEEESDKAPLAVMACNQDR